MSGNEEVLDAEETPVVGVALSAVEAQTRGEIDMQVATAHKFPRSMARFRKRVVELATLDEEVARGCFYALPRAGRTIEGPSVRMAEIVACSYGNLRVASRIVDDGDPRTVTVEATAFDLEANYAVRAEVRQIVAKRRDGKQDDDLRNLAAMAAQSKARRNAIFGVVPGSEIKAIMGHVRKVAIGNAATLGERRARVMEVLGKMGASEKRVLPVIGVESVQDITLDQVLTLQVMADQIRNGESQVDDLFPLGTANPAVGGKASGSKVDALKEKLGVQPKAPAEPEKATTEPAATVGSPPTATVRRKKVDPETVEKAPPPKSAPSHADLLMELEAAHGELKRAILEGKHLGERETLPAKIADLCYAHGEVEVDAALTEWKNTGTLSLEYVQRVLPALRKALAALS